MSNHNSKKIQMPLIIFIAPPGSQFPDGFPVTVDVIDNEFEALQKLARALIKRNDVDKDGGTTPVTEVWQVSTQALRFALLIKKEISGIEFKAFRDAPEGDYSAPWTMLAAPLPGYSVQVLSAHTDMENPHEQVASTLTDEAQVAKLNKTLADYDKLGQDDSIDLSALSKLGDPGKDDTYE